MPGNEWQQFANLRAYYANMYAHPGKKLLFMGSELAQHQEWSHDRSLDWHLLEYPNHSGMQELVKDLNHVYKQTPAFFEIDFDGEGFEWIDWDDRDNSVFSWIRRDRSGGYAICISNFTPVTRHDYRIGVTAMNPLREVINTDAEKYGGSGAGNGEIMPGEQGHHGKPYSVSLTIPPLATLILLPE
jgi:1,4-alpha-glucan branching enzyme